MIHVRNILVVVALLGLGGEIHAAQSSSMGYSIEVPDNWIAVTREEIAENPDLFENMQAGEMNEDLFMIIRRKIQSGNVDMYFRQSDQVTDFVDNVNVMKQIQRTASTREELEGVCENLPGQLSNAFGRQISLHGCEFRTVDGRKSVYLDFDGARKDTRTIQYQVPVSGSIVLVISATTKSSTLDAVRPEFSNMIRSLRVE